MVEEKFGKFLHSPIRQIFPLYGICTHYLFMHQARLQVADFSARRLSIRDIKRLLLSEGSVDSTIEKFCAWVGAG